MRTACCMLLSIVLAQAVTAHCVAAAPKVVKAFPDNGDVDIDPGLKEIRITFDQAMGEGMSVVGGGETFPQMVGKPRWTTARTIVMRVKLQPNHEYWLSINNDRFQNFTNRQGEPAEAYPIQFRTGSAGSGAKRAKAAEEPGETLAVAADHQEAVKLLRKALLDHYSYRDRLSIDWDKLIKSRESALLAAKSPLEFARIAGTLLARAEDKHIWLQAGKETVPSYVRPSVPNANYALLPKLVPELKRHGRYVVSGRWDDGTGYFAIASWDRVKLEDGKPIFAAYEALQDAPALIIDVRANGGGDERLAQEFAGCFVTERQLYGQNVYRDPESATGFTPPRERWLEPNAGHSHFNGKVAVLSGPAVMSSCESFLLMMKTVPRAIVVGAASQGSSGNPKPHDLGNGVMIFLPSWKDMTADGQELEGVGVRPDIEVKSTPADFETADPVLEAARAHLRGG